MKITFTVQSTEIRKRKFLHVPKVQSISLTLLRSIWLFYQLKLFLKIIFFSKKKRGLLCSNLKSSLGGKRKIKHPTEFHAKCGEFTHPGRLSSWEARHPEIQVSEKMSIHNKDSTVKKK